MNDVEQLARGGREEVDLGHPVRSFSLVMVALGVALLGLQWSGLLQPRVLAQAHGQHESSSGYGVSTVVENEGATRVEVLDATWPVHGSAVTEILLGAPGETNLATGATAPFSPFSLEAGEGRVVSLVVRSGCPAEIGELELRIRTAAGVTREVRVDDLGGVASAGSC